jgi:hypothetical protein
MPGLIKSLLVASALFCLASTGFYLYVCLHEPGAPLAGFVRDVEVLTAVDLRVRDSNPHTGLESNRLVQTIVRSHPGVVFDRQHLALRSDEPHPGSHAFGFGPVMARIEPAAAATGQQRLAGALLVDSAERPIPVNDSAMARYADVVAPVPAAGSRVIIARSAQSVEPVSTGALAAKASPDFDSSSGQRPQGQETWEGDAAWSGDTLPASGDREESPGRTEGLFTTAEQLYRSLYGWGAFYAAKEEQAKADAATQ